MASLYWKNNALETCGMFLVSSGSFCLLVCFCFSWFAFSLRSLLVFRVRFTRANFLVFLALPISSSSSSSSFFFFSNSSISE